MARSRMVRVEAGDVLLWGDLGVPVGARGLVVFVHGADSTRHSPRDRQVAERLRSAGFGTLLFDLMTLHEEGFSRRGLPFDVLSRRVVAATAWVLREPEAAGLALGFFGSDSGVAVALAAAAARPDVVRAVVCRGGRPDQAADVLPRVVAPTLLVVGDRDPVVLAMNQQAESELGGPWQLLIVEGAGHRFEEYGALDEVAQAAARWFGRHLPLPTPPRRATTTQSRRSPS